MSTAEKVYLEVRRLPEPLAKEVLVFVGNLVSKYTLRERQTDSLMDMQEPVMRRVWDNAEDEVWNDV